MRIVSLLIAVLIINIFAVSVVYAEEDPTPAPQPQIQWTNEFTVQDEPSTIVTLLKNFIEGFDSFMGGFIFYTPDPLANTITLKDESTIPGVTKYRNTFYQIAIPIIAIIVSFIALSKLGTDNSHELKSFATRFFTLIVLFIVVPPLLSYSIQFNNLLIERISETQKFTGFLNNYFDQAQTKIEDNQSSEKFGIPSFDMSLTSGIFKSFGKFIVQIFLFAITFLFLLCGFLFIGFQFVIRFATLLFLGVIYPLVLPFILSEKTQNIIYTFFKIWITFLIQQPAFVLGFAIVTDIFNSILNAQGPSVGMLFFYTGFLFFLGGVNVLVGRIFGDAWGAMSNNMMAMVSTRAVTSTAGSGMHNLNRSSAVRGLKYNVGQQLTNIWSSKSDTNKSSSFTTNASGKNNKEYVDQSINQHSFTKNETALAPHSNKLSQKGFAVNQENPKQGFVSVSGSAYRHENNKSGLVSYYPTITEAVQDGIPQEKLQPVELKNEQFIDLSSFNDKNPNPHNYNAMQESKKQGKSIDYAYVNDKSPQHKVKRFLDISEGRNLAYGVKGVIVERQAKKGTDPVIRMYSTKSYEKRKNI